jgi:hypothetical protein
MGCFQRVSRASYVLHVQWVRSGACIRQTCLRAGAGWCEVFTVYCMLVPISFYMSMSNTTVPGHTLDSGSQFTLPAANSDFLRQSAAQHSHLLLQQTAQLLLPSSPDAVNVAARHTQPILAALATAWPV